MEMLAEGSFVCEVCEFENIVSVLKISLNSHPIVH